MKRWHRHPLPRLAWCAVGVAAGIALALRLTAPPVTPLMLASLGGSAVFLFGLTRAPAAQPRALLGGHFSGALIGVLCYQWFGDALWVYALALTLSLLFMLSARAVHPPAGANPVIMIHAHAGYALLFNPVLIGALCLGVLAALWSRLYPGLARYPVDWNAHSPHHALWGGWGDAP